MTTYEQDKSGRFEFFCGTTIEEAYQELASTAREMGVAVEGKFNDWTIRAEPGQLASDLVTKWYDDREAERRAWEASPAGIEAAREAEKWQKELAAIAARGPEPFDVLESAAADWQKTMDANSDGYGAGIVRYAARWAHLMDAQLAAGCKLEAVADRVSHEADIESITGFMYGAAVAILSGVWRHGEELRQWHNLKTQIRGEGERANREGGVLNPAVLVME